ncbi:hypothetical protein ACFQZS_14050 [Mucilaginibacter calamicampi]|uniref:Uncharacterized protein n=1 Tax=Mucilaginibacter calamicampi TaxID=1302352 RepID=A0ABW2YXS5_9SPHI
MQNELTQLIKSNVEASFLIKNNLTRALNELVEDYTSQLDSICKPMGLTCKDNVDFEERYTGFFIFKPEWEYANIGFQFQNYNRELRFGIVAKRDPGKFPNDLRIKLRALPNNNKKENDWWPWHNFAESPFADWSKVEAWKAIEDRRMLNFMKQKIEMLLAMIGNIKL